MSRPKTQVCYPLNPIPGEWELILEPGRSLCRVSFLIEKPSTRGRKHLPWVTERVISWAGWEPRFPICQSWAHPFATHSLLVLDAYWWICSLSRRRVHHSQKCWVPQSPWAQPRGRFSASLRCSCCAKFCRFPRMSLSWLRSLHWFTNSTALDSSCPTWVRRQSPSSKPLGRIIMSLHPRSAFSVAAHYSKGDKSKQPFQIYPVPSCLLSLGPSCNLCRFIFCSSQVSFTFPIAN